MAKVRIVYDSLFAGITLRQQELLAVNRETLSAVLHRLGDTYGDRFRETLFKPESPDIRPEIVVLVNGQHQGLESELEEGDELVLFTPLAGG